MNRLDHVIGDPATGETIPVRDVLEDVRDVEALLRLASEQLDRAVRTGLVCNEDALLLDQAWSAIADYLVSG